MHDSDTSLSHVCVCVCVLYVYASIYTTGLAASMNNIGEVYRKQGDMQRALTNYHKSIAMYQSIGQKNGLSPCYNNMGHVYKAMKNAVRALECYRKSYDIDKRNGVLLCVYVCVRVCVCVCE